ncbi:transposase, IS4-like family protein [Leptospira santarosai str. 2000030832]|nr:transposase, IS4-like family protein [Leptospira santarosai str. 2000030832]
MFPDAKTIWLFKEKLKEAELMPKIFYWFNRYLEKSGFKVSEGTIVDATILEVPKQRNTKEENAQVKKGEVPSEWKKNHNKLYQKDTDARWTKKGNCSFFGYKNHIFGCFSNAVANDLSICCQLEEFNPSGKYLTCQPISESSSRTQ